MRDDNDYSKRKSFSINPLIDTHFESRLYSGDEESNFSNMISPKKPKSIVLNIANSQASQNQYDI